MAAPYWFTSGHVFNTFSTPDREGEGLAERNADLQVDQRLASIGVLHATSLAGEPGGGCRPAVRASGGAEARGTEVVSARPCPDGGGGAAEGALYQDV